MKSPLPLTVAVKVQPKSKKRYVEKIDDEHFKIGVHAAPEKGNANREVIKALAAFLGLPPSSLSIVKGHKSRNKLIKINTGREK